MDMEDAEIEGRLKRLEQRVSILEGLQVSTIRKVAEEIENNKKA